MRICTIRIKARETRLELLHILFVRQRSEKNSFPPSAFGIIYGANDSVYVRDSEDFEVGDAYSFYRKGEEFLDPVTGEVLGYQATHIADGEVTEAGDPATVYISKAEREVLRGDRLISLETSDAGRFYPFGIASV